MGAGENEREKVEEEWREEGETYREKGEEEEKGEGR